MLIAWLALALCVSAQDASTEKPALMERLVQSLPQIPDVIKGQMEGKPDELKKMISSMLGDGLLSQLVVNPVGVAENMGVPLNQLGINQTTLAKTMPTLGNGTGSSFNFFEAFTPSTTTTKKVMYVDGVPIKDFDEFIRKHNLEEKGYTTSKPPTTTTPFTPEKVAEVVLKQLKDQQREVQLPQVPIQHQSDLANQIDMNMIDPRRVAEVNSLLRRSPQRYESMDSLALGMDLPQPGPPGFNSARLDPAVDEVVTNLRTKGTYGLTVDDVKRLQGILQSYEQNLQTKELLTRRKQLQVLQTELQDQRKRIELQKRMEEELRRKEKELEDAKEKMEQQLREQLNSWHSSFGSAEMPLAPLALDSTVQKTQVAMPPAPAAPAPPQQSSFVVEKEEPKEVDENELALAQEREQIVAQQNQVDVRPAKISSNLRSQLRYSPTPVVKKPVEDVPPSTSVRKEGDDFASTCECEKVSLEKMKGTWVLALASKNILEDVQMHTSNLLGVDNATLFCSRFDVGAGKQSSAAQDARLQWQFKTVDSPRIRKMRGSALTIDHKSIRVQMVDFSGENFSFPFCVVKSGGGDSYDYMLVTASQGDCKETALMVRDPQEFFDAKDPELTSYLKNKIRNDDMSPLKAVDFANDCS